MYWQLVVVAFAVFWLLHRAYGLVTAPLDQIIKTLSVDIPKAATISVDNITDTAVYIHWDKHLKEIEQRAFLLFINGQQVSSLGGRDVHSHITGLLPNTKYRIDLVTVNHRSYKSKSRSVYIKTKSKELQSSGHSNSENPLENPEALFKLLTDNSGLSVEKLPTINVTAAPGESGDTATPAATPNGRRGGRSRSNTVSSALNADMTSTAVASINMLPDPKSIEDIEELRYYLESRQEELHLVLNQQSQILQEFKEQEAFLCDERQKLRERKKLEDNNRALVKSQIKNLDELRRNTELKKAKQEAVIQSKKKLIEKMTLELNEWSSKIDHFEQDKTNIETSEDKVHEALDTDAEEKKVTVKELQAQISTLEDEIKQLLLKKKQREQNKPQLHKIFKNLSRHTDVTGLLNQEAVQNLELLKTIEPPLWERLNKEIELDSQLEARWRAEQQRAVSNCEKVESTYKTLLKEGAQLKNGQIDKSPQPVTQAMPILHNVSGSGSGSNNLIFSSMQQHQQPSNNNSGSNSFNNGYFAGSTSPPSQSLNFQSSLWANNGLSLSYNNTNKLSINTSLKSSELLKQEELDTPSIDHFLPANLIGEEFNDMAFPMSPEKSSTGSEGIGSGGCSTPKNTNPSLVTASGAPSFNQTLQFPSEFSNLSSRSIFHNDFGITPQPVRLSFENPTSPQLSHQHEFLSAHNSPATNNNDIASLFSGGTVDVLPTFSQTSSETKPTTHKSTFSPRRLSSVFGFGSKTKNISATLEANGNGVSTTAAHTSNASKHSKFFHRSQNSDLDPPPPTEPPLFRFSQEHQTQATSNSAFNILDVWSSPFTDSSHAKHPSVDDPKLEDTRVWSNNTTDHNTSGESKFVGVPSSSNSLSSQAISDVNNSELGPIVQLTDTNKSTKSTKSKSSIDGASSFVPPSNSSPGFFRRKSNLLNFGYNKSSQANPERSPVKQHSTLSRMESPTRINSYEDGDIEEFNPSVGSSKKLFSRRMSFNTNIRKQSNSSHETDSTHLLDQNSVQSNSTTNSRSIVRKLSLFGNKIKDSNVIDEQEDEDETH